MPQEDGNFHVNSNLVTYEGDVYAIGIKELKNDDVIEIHRLSCPEEECKWTRIRQEEIKHRYTFVVLPISDSFYNCV